MNEGLKEVYNHYLGLSAEERFDYANNAAGAVASFLQAQGCADDDIFGFVLNLVGLAIGADGYITPEETTILNRLFGWSYKPQDLAEFAGNSATVDNLRALDNIVDSMDNDTKLAACVVVLAVISADGEIEENEAAALEILLADHLDF